MSPSSGQKTLRRLVSRMARSPARISTVSVSVGNAMRRDAGPTGCFPPADTARAGRRDVPSRLAAVGGATRGRAQLRERAPEAAVPLRGRLGGDGACDTWRAAAAVRRAASARGRRGRVGGGGQLELARARAGGAADLGHRPPGHDRAGLRDGEVLSARVLVPVLDEKPLPATARPDEHPRTLELLPQQHELEIALRELAIGIGLVPEPSLGDRRPDALVPDHHGSAAVRALGDHALELVVVHRMRLGLHGEPLDGGIERRPLGDRPGEHHPAVLQAEVVVERRRAVLLDDELERLPRFSRPRISARLGRDVEVALPVVLGEPAVRAHVGQPGVPRGRTPRPLPIP